MSIHKKYRARSQERVAGGQVELQADGPHIRLSGLKAELKPGENVSLTLMFDDGSQTSVLAPVKAH